MSYAFPTLPWPVTGAKIIGMAEVTCVDGSVLGVLGVPVADRDGVPYEVTLRMTRNGEPFGEVGERCGYFVAGTAARLRVARGKDEEGFTESSVETGLRAWARDVDEDPDEAWHVLRRYLPRDRELFAFRARDPDDLATVGELRTTLEVKRSWADGRWSLRYLAVLQAWGPQGTGVRAVLTSADLQRFLDDLMADFAAVGATYDETDDASPLRRPVG